MKVKEVSAKRGERKILLSKHRNLLTGFSLNKKTSFESIIRHPVTCQIDRNSARAIIQLFNAMEFIVHLNDNIPLKDDKTLILSLGLQMGMPVSDSVINPVKYAGCARIMAVG